MFCKKNFIIFFFENKKFLLLNFFNFLYICHKHNDLLITILMNVDDTVDPQ